MRYILRALALVGVTLFVAACNPFGPANYPGYFKFEIDGQPHAATSDGRLALGVAGTIGLTGINCDSGQSFSIQISAPVGMGPRTVASGVTASYEADTRTSGASVLYSAGPQGYPGSGGLVTIDSLTNDTVKGSFDFTMVPFGGGTSKRATGTFELEIADKTIC